MRLERERKRESWKKVGIFFSRQNTFFDSSKKYENKQLSDRRSVEIVKTKERPACAWAKMWSTVALSHTWYSSRRMREAREYGWLWTFRLGSKCRLRTSLQTGLRIRSSHPQGTFPRLEELLKARYWTVRGLSSLLEACHVGLKLSLVMNAVEAHLQMLLTVVGVIQVRQQASQPGNGRVRRCLSSVVRPSLKHVVHIDAIKSVPDVDGRRHPRIIQGYNRFLREALLWRIPTISHKNIESLCWTHQP